VSDFKDSQGQGYPGHWVGRFIWTGGDPHPFHFHLMARRNFNLEAAPRVAVVHITAEDRYLLYANGAYRGRGPARSDARLKSYDTYDVTPHLRRGANTIAVLAYHYGCMNGYTRDTRAGLFAQLEVTAPDGNRQLIGTDEHWKLHQAQGWWRDVEPINAHIGVTEIYDATVDPLGWTEPEFDDSDWAPAQVISERESPWSCLQPRQTPMLVEEEIFPQRVVQLGEVMEFAKTAGAGRVPERLAIEPHFPLQYASIENPEALLSSDANATVVQSTGFEPGDDFEQGVRSPYLVVDFGRPVFGFPRVSLEAPEESAEGSASIVVEGGMIKLAQGPGGSVDITYGLTMIGDRILPLTGGPRFGDRYLMRKGKQTWQTFEYKQFRYMQIVLRDVKQPVRVKSVSVMSYQYPALRKGHFECSDPTLTKVWKACLDTTYQHMEDTIVCDAWRERRCYSGDGAHGLYGVWAGYGDLAVTDWYFRLFARGQLSDGAMRTMYPGTEGRPDGERAIMQATVYENPDIIPYATIFYPLLLAGDYYHYFGKLDLVEELFSTLERAANWCERHADETGLLYNLPYWNFFDWAPNDTQGANFQVNALYCWMLVNLARLARDLGRHKLADKWAAQADQVKGCLRRLHWNPDQELYATNVSEGKQSTIFSELANGLALLCGIATQEQAEKIIQKIADPRSDIARPSPLNLYYVIEGLIKVGAAGTAQKLMCEQFQPMLGASDFPTIWESWSPYVRERGALIGRELYVGELPSYLHSGGVGPAWTMSKHFLGVYPIGPGFQKCRIAPQIGDLQWAHGVFPSVRGNIEVAWRKEDGRFSLNGMLPDGLETEFALTRDHARNLKLIHNAERLEIPAGTKSAPGVELSEEQIVIRVSGGRHQIELTANE
jgi:alpha-L-rhamnosidase